MYLPGDNGKFGKWLTPRTVLSFDKSSGVVKVPGKTSKTISVAVEDVGITPIEDEFAHHICETKDQLTKSIDELISMPVEINSNDSSISENSNSIEKSTSENFDDSDGFDQNDEPILAPSVGDRIEVFWPIDDQLYPCTVGSITDDRLHVINYDYGDNETLSFKDENWRSEDTITVNMTTLKSNIHAVLQDMLSVFGT